ncbi:TIGR00730 family Rossman fold protein [Megasphaera sp.]
MNITVYLGSHAGNNPAYTTYAYQLGAWIAQNGHTLIYGGSRTGLMGTLADGALSQGGRVIGIEPQSFVDQEYQHDGLTELIVTGDMLERKEKMLAMGDLFLAFPGGLGTLEEMSEAMDQIKLGFVKGRFAFLDFEGYYQPLKAYFQHMADEGFLDADFVKAIPFLPSLAALTAFTLGRELPQPGETWRHFKNRLYRILDIATDAETGESYVVYKTLYGEYRDFIRPLSMFLSEVDHEKYPDVKQKWRFEKTAGLCSWNPAVSQQYMKKESSQ